MMIYINTEIDIQLIRCCIAVTNNVWHLSSILNLLVYESQQHSLIWYFGVYFECVQWFPDKYLRLNDAVNN